MAETELFSNFWFWAWIIFITGLHVALAERFKRGKWKWGVLGFFLGLVSFIWLMVLGENKEKSV